MEGRAPDTLTVQVQGRGTGVAVITADGVIDLSTHPVLERAAAACIDRGDRPVILDLSRVSLCDSTGLSALIRLHRRAEQAAGRDDAAGLRLAGVQPQVLRILEITDLIRLLSIYDSVADARAPDPSG